MKSFSYLLAFLLLFPSFLISQSCDGIWQTGYQRPGVFSVPKAMAADPNGTYLYVGDPEQFGGDPDIEKVGRWDGKTWKGLGDFQCTSCGSGVVESLVCDPAGNLYIGGFFEGVTDANGTFTASKNVIKWNASTETFEGLGFGVEATRVYALAFRNDTLYVGGDISAAKNPGADLPVNNIALFDLTAQTWSAMGQGIESFNLNSSDNGDVLALTFASTGELLVGGSFSKINGNTTVHSTAKWTANGGWQALGNGISNILDIGTPPPPTPGTVREFAVDPATGTIYAVGSFGNFYGAGKGLASLVNASAATWTYSTGLGNLPSGGRWQTYAVHLDPIESYLYVGGNFNSDDADPFSPVPGEYVARMNLANNQWEPLNAGITEAQPGLEVQAIQKFQDRIYVGGNFLEVDDRKCRYLASWGGDYGTYWDILGDGLGGACDELFSFGIGGIPIGGRFSCLSGRELSGYALPVPGTGWFSTNFFAANGYTPAIHDIYSDSQGFLYAGAFDSANTLIGPMTLATGIISEDFIGINTPLATSLGGPGNFQTVYAVTKWQGKVVIGGTFTSVDGVSANGLAIRDSSGTWTELANIGSGTVRDLYNDGDSLLYIGGTFSTVNGNYLEGLAVFDGSNWSPLGQSLGFYHDVFSIAKDPMTGEIAIGGGFQTVTQTDGTPLNSAGLAFWDGTQWSSKGEVQAAFTNPAQYARIVRSVDYDEDGVLYIGGEFSGVGNIAANRIARHTPGIGWEAFGKGITGSDCNGYPVVNVVRHHSSKLRIGGKFSRVDDIQSHGYAEYDMNIQSLSLLPDTFDVYCDSTFIQGLPGFSNWQWSTGDTGDSAVVRGDYFDSLANENRRVWVYATAERDGCVFTDSIEVAYVGSNPVLSYGTFEIGDSTYLYYEPAYDTAYAEYDVWVINLGIFLDSPTDTVAFQMPCSGGYEASVRMQTNGCIVFWQFSYGVFYDRPVDLIDEIQSDGCQQSTIIANAGYSNIQWSTGDVTPSTQIDSAMMAGLDSLMITVSADTMWSDGLDTLSCTYYDTAWVVRHENFASPVEQDYLPVQVDSFKVEFYKQFPGKVELLDMNYGDGTMEFVYPVDHTIGSVYTTHKYPGPGTYTVTAHAYPFDCPSNSNFISFPVMVGTSSLQENPLSETRIVPNPSQGAFSLELPETIQGPLDIQVTDLKGRAVWQEQTSYHPGGPFSVHLPELPSGIYPVHIRFSEASWVVRAVLY